MRIPFMHMVCPWCTVYAVAVALYTSLRSNGLVASLATPATTEATQLRDTRLEIPNCFHSHFLQKQNRRKQPCITSLCIFETSNDATAHYSGKGSIYCFATQPFRKSPASFSFLSFSLSASSAASGAPLAMMHRRRVCVIPASSTAW